MDSAPQPCDCLTKTSGVSKTKSSLNHQKTQPSTPSSSSSSSYCSSPPSSVSGEDAWLRSITSSSSSSSENDEAEQKSKSDKKSGGAAADARVEQEMRRVLEAMMITSFGVRADALARYRRLSGSRPKTKLAFAVWQTLVEHRIPRNPKDIADLCGVRPKKFSHSRARTHTVRR